MRTDEQIRDDIMAEIDFDPKVEATDIGVTVKDGAVTLHGTVHSYFEELAVIKAAKRVKGVHAVVEEIKIKYPSDTQVDDQDIAERIAHLCEWNTTFRKYDIKAEVKNGRVTLTGNVDWQYQRADVRDYVARLRGVTGVTNSITIRPHASQLDVKRKISEALHRSATLESSKINVDVADGQVTLKGHVKAWYERKLAEDAAWSAPGVTRVVDQIQIS
ncbi:BON domain-containing protein [Roseobacter sp. GAI101]|uniref:BON domain-containing protein n=1 Tax=Roseobacter sp. (strain GAI101) TaxID=391589 RepID=UPI0001871A37|nr:BON domain-containing protein [Roseobacter sp. GAI101]EEB82843.1 transport-associated [Roseobacter sp. GAI101]